MNDLDLLGADSLTTRKITVSRSVLSIGAGALAYYFLPTKHKVLAFLGGAALASNAHALYTKERNFKETVKRLGKHFVAMASSLALPKHPAIGYVAGAVAAEMLIDGEGNGLIEEWTEPASRPTIIDAEYTDVKPTALVKR